MEAASDGWSHDLQSHSMGEFADNENQAFADAEAGPDQRSPQT
jgi:hypothetical protein